MLKGICFNFKELMKIRQVEYQCRTKILLEALELLSCQHHLGKGSFIDDVMNGFSNIREVSYKIAIKVNSTHKTFKLQWRIKSRLLSNSLHFSKTRVHQASWYVVKPI